MNVLVGPMIELNGGLPVERITWKLVRMASTETLESPDMASLTLDIRYPRQIILPSVVLYMTRRARKRRAPVK